MGAFQSLRPTAAPVIDHPYFGPLRASAGSCDAAWLWESLDLVKTPGGWVDLSFAAGPAGPSEAHRRQLHAILAQLDSLTRAAAPMIFATFTQWLERPPSDNPAAELDWQGAHLTGRPGEFSLHFAWQHWPESLLTVRFLGLRPTAVEIDD